MLMNYLPEFHKINHVTRDISDENVYIVNISASIDGIKEDVDYVSSPNDPFGLAPQVREALEQWIAEGGVINEP